MFRSMTILVAVLLGLSLSGCSGEARKSDAAARISIAHHWGTTVLQQLPQRVATISWTNDDIALALGVVPVAMPKVSWGGDAEGLTPWKRKRLEELGATPGSEKFPKLYVEAAQEPNYTELAQARPDVILAAYSGLNRESYEKLAKIAPVVAYPDKPYGTAWQDSTRLIGQTLGKEKEAEALIAKTEQTLHDKASQFPQLAGKSFIAGNLEVQGQGRVNIYTPSDSRSRLLQDLGLVMAPVVQNASRNVEGFYMDWSLEKSRELESDVFLAWLPQGMAQESVKNDPLLGQIPAIARGGLLAETDATRSLAFSAVSPLSLSWLAETFVSQLAAAVDESDARKGQ